MPDESTAAPAAVTETGAAAETGAALSTPAGQNGKEQSGTAGLQPVTQPEAAPEAAVSDDWRAVIDEPSLRELADRITGPKDVLKIIADLRKANGSMVKLPGKDAKPEEVEKFRKAVGAGNDEAAYLKAFAVPEDAPANEFVQNLHTKLAGVFLKHNTPVAAAIEAAEVIKEADLALDHENNRIALKGREDSEAELRKELGADYEAHVAFGKKARNDFGSPHLESLLDNTHINGQKLGDHPELRRFFGNVGRRTSGAGFIGAVGAEERGSVQGRIDELHRQNPVGTPQYASSAVQRELAELHEKLYGTQPIVGRGRGV